MADTTKSIKNATDEELHNMISRVGRERDILRLLKELKLKSMPNPNGAFPKYSTSEAFSTETPIRDGKSIKEMTDEELTNFNYRLQNENELARLLMDIRDMNTPTSDTNGMYPIGQTYEGISLDTPVKDLYHVGILGMRWGHRKSSGSSDASEDHTTAQNLKKKSLKSLSNSELKKLNERMQLEQNYKNLNPSSISKGSKIVKGVLAAGTTVASIYALSKSPMATAVISGLKSKLKGG